MSSDEDYIPPLAVLAGPRRSKRILESEKRTLRSDRAKEPKKKAAKRSAGKSKSAPDKKFKTENSPKEQRSSEKFDGSCLTPVELQQLLIKFTRDGHFHVTPLNPSPPPLVISRTTDGKTVTTKIECYDDSWQHVRDVAKTLPGQTSVAAGPEETSNSTAVTFSLPVDENLPGNSLPADASCDRSIHSSHKNYEAIRTKNCCKKTQNALPIQQRNFGAGNPTTKNSAGPNQQLKSILTAGDSRTNKSPATSGFSAFESVRPIQPARPSPANLIFTGPASSSWIPPGQSTSVDQSGPNACGAYRFGNETQCSRTFGSAGLAGDVSKNYSHGNLVLPNFPNRYDYTSYTAANRNVYYQSGEANARCPLQIPAANSLGSSGDWNAAGQTSSNDFNSGYGVACASQTGGFDNSPYDASSSLSSTSDNTGYSDFAAWNGEQFSPNPYVHGAPSVYQTQPIVGNQQIHGNFWCQDNQASNGFFGSDQKAIDDSSTTVMNNFAGNPTMIGGNVVSASQSQIEESASSHNLRDSQSNDSHPKTSSGCSYNGVSYDNYMGGNYPRSNENSVLTARGNESSSRLPSVTTIKTEMRSWCDGGNSLYGSSGRSTADGDAGCVIVDVVYNTSSRA